MKILVDTNVVLDVVLKRPEFVESSTKALEKALINGDGLYFSGSAVTDVYYLTKKQTCSRTTALKAVANLVDLFAIANVDEDCILDALSSKLNDFEDAVIESVALSINADCILTRNLNDYKESKVKALSPFEYLDN